MRTFTLCAAMIASLSIAVHAQPAAERPTVAPVSYESFVQLDPPARLRQFQTLSPDNKALIFRTHAERWRDQHRSRLTAAQISLVEEVIAFMTPEVFRRPMSRDVDERLGQLEAKFRCQLPRSYVRELFGAMNGPSRPASWLDDVWTWFQDCVIG